MVRSSSLILVTWQSATCESRLGSLSRTFALCSGVRLVTDGQGFISSRRSIGTTKPPSRGSVLFVAPTLDARQEQKPRQLQQQRRQTGREIHSHGGCCDCHGVSLLQGSRKRRAANAVRLHHACGAFSFCFVRPGRISGFWEHGWWWSRSIAFRTTRPTPIMTLPAIRWGRPMSYILACCLLAHCFHFSIPPSALVVCLSVQQ